MAKLANETNTAKIIQAQIGVNTQIKIEITSIATLDTDRLKNVFVSFPEESIFV